MKFSSHPTRDAWIEIDFATQEEEIDCRIPHGMRGLKYEALRRKEPGRVASHTGCVD